MHMNERTATILDAAADRKNAEAWEEHFYAMTEGSTDPAAKAKVRTLCQEETALRGAAYNTRNPARA